MTDGLGTGSVIYIDPPGARRFLEKNVRNRYIKESHVRRLMDEMLSGRWQYNAEPIQFSTHELLNGQHRLTALSRLDDSFGALPFFVVRDLPPESQDSMDQGRTRTAADQLCINKIGSNSSAIAAAIRIYLQWTENRLFGDQVTKGKVGNTRVVEWATKHPKEVALMDEILCVQLRRVKIRPSLGLAIMLRLHLLDTEAAREFAASLYTGAGLETGNAILTLRERLDRIQGVKTSDRDYIAFFVLAWNAWRTGRSMTKFQRPHGGSWSAENFPQPI